MDIRDYAAMVSRAWGIAVVVLLLTVAASASYYLVTPRTYEASISLLLIAQDPKDLSAAQLGAQAADSLADTTAGVIDSPAVLTRALAGARVGLSVDEAAARVDAQVRGTTSIIDVTVRDGSPTRAETLANSIAKASQQVLPLLQNRNEGNAVIQLRTIRSASLPLAAVTPVARQVLGLGLLVGLVLGALSAVIFSTFDTKIRVHRDLERTALRRLGSTPRMHLRAAGGLEALHGRTVRSYQSACLALMRMASEDIKIVRLTSPTSRDYSPDSAVGLAVALSSMGNRVALVNWDFSEGQIARLQSVVPPNAVSRELDDKAVNVTDIYRRKTPSASFTLYCTNAARRPSPVQLKLTSPVELITAIQREYDLILFNTPPLNDVSQPSPPLDPAAITVLTVRAGRTRRVEFENAQVLLQDAHVARGAVLLVRN